MNLRSWQSDCIKSAISKYAHKKHFLALATPGAGKTMMASVLAKKLYELGKVDLVFCFSPSSIVAYDFSCALSEQFTAYFDGTMGAMGNSYTYQGLNTLNDSVWNLFVRYRVFVIFDEIHHCAGSNLQDSNAWGAPIIGKIKDQAAYTIALTGTPWRSDSLPIVLAEYCNESGHIQCDFSYGLKEAIRDKVCRVPQVVALDNDQITLLNGDESSHFGSFNDLLSKSNISYSQIVTDEAVIVQLLLISNAKLDELRGVNPDAGGLIVASSISHAWKIHLQLKKSIGVNAIVVTSNEGDPNSIINTFRYNEERWIISVGMISEGTNIPRLQVCCYLSNIKTEMYYRQVLGRILRITSHLNQEAFFFMPAAPKLVKYAYRVAQDLPDGLSKVKFAQMNQELITEASTFDLGEPVDAIHNTLAELFEEAFIDPSSTADFGDKVKSKDLAVTYDRAMDILGQFYHKELEIDGFDHLAISEQSMDKLAHFSVQEF